MNEQRFPRGWDEERVKKLLAELDARTDEEPISAGTKIERALRSGEERLVNALVAGTVCQVRSLAAARRDCGGCPVSLSNRDPPLTPGLLWPVPYPLR